MTATVGLYFITVSEKVYLIALGIFTLIATFIIICITIKMVKHPYPKLAKYIKHSLQKGHEKDKIKKALTDAGWPEHLADYELKKHQ